LGLDRLRAINLNDSKKDLGSRVDRHEHIGKGLLGLEPFRFLVNDARFRGMPMTLETEKGPDLAEDKENLETLRALIDQPG
jgi:deoxyribonuclease-4